MKAILRKQGVVLRSRLNYLFAFVPLLAVALASNSAVAQTPTETPPPPSDPPGLTLPNVEEMTLPNGLRVVVVQRKNVPLVTAALLIKKGAADENPKKAGTASMTAELLTKGTEFRNATEIAEEIEFLGASLDTEAGWNNSTASIGVMSDKLGKALSIMSNSVIRPVFPQKELELSRKQALDGFSVSLKQPGALLNYAAAPFTFGEHPTSGTPETVKGITRKDLVSFHELNYRPGNSVLIFTGDISPEEAFGFARLFFGGWQKGDDSAAKTKKEAIAAVTERPATVSRILVIDLPDSGQAAVGFTNALKTGRTNNKSEYYAATVLNSVLGGGYSARLNQEIRLKRGLSYGARSGFSWRSSNANFVAVAQTKNESAGEVAELIRIEIEKLINDTIEGDEMVPRKAVVTGGFGRGLQTNDGLANELTGLYTFGLSAEELNSYMGGIKAVEADDIKRFAANYLNGGDLIIVGDSKLFLEDLKKRFPGSKVEVVKSTQLNLNSRTLRK